MSTGDTTLKLVTDKMIDWPASVDAAPKGWRWGAHVSLGARGEGYYMIRESDHAALIARQRPDLGADDTPTDEEIAEAFGDR